MGCRNGASMSYWIAVNGSAGLANSLLAVRQPCRAWCPLTTSYGFRDASQSGMVGRRRWRDLVPPYGFTGSSRKSSSN